MGHFKIESNVWAAKKKGGELVVKDLTTQSRKQESSLDGQEKEIDFANIKENTSEKEGNSP